MAYNIIESQELDKEDNHISLVQDSVIFYNFKDQKLTKYKVDQIWVRAGSVNLQNLQKVVTNFPKVKNELSWFLASSDAKIVSCVGGMDIRTERRNLEKRPDDNHDIAIKRFKMYEKNIDPILDFYKETNLLKVVNGETSISEISDEISRLIKSIKG